MNAAVAVEFLYGIEAGHEELNDWVPARVVSFRITKKTPRRIYYTRETLGTRRLVGFVDRQAIERDGQVRRRSSGWWEPDSTVYLEPPELPSAAPRPDLGELRAAMAAAHPDRGGTDAEFIAARERYERARAAA